MYFVKRRKRGELRNLFLLTSPPPSAVAASASYKAITAARPRGKRCVLVSMLALFVCLHCSSCIYLGAKRLTRDEPQAVWHVETGGVQANRRYCQHLTSASLEQLLQVMCGLCMTI